MTAGVLKSFAEIDPSVDFYIVGLKTNSSRIAVKFIYRRKFGDILQNIVKHQQDMQVREKGRAVSISDMEKELVFSKCRQNTLNSELLAKLFEAIICGHSYPEFLLSTVIRRIKTDSDEEKNKHIKINDTRIGIIKACINRRSRISGQKEEIKMALDKENRNPAYLCGRLFAVLEAIQQKASNYFLNRTIRDSYFASAAANPAVMFPKLIKLSQYHLSKIGDPKYFTDDVKEIVDLLGSEFPGTLTLTEQGKFIIGYYQQQKYTDERKKLIQEVKNNGNQ